MLRYQGQHMLVCEERARDQRQAGWHRRRIFTPVPAEKWGQEFFVVIGLGKRPNELQSPD